MQSLRGNGSQNGRQNGEAAVRLIVSALDALDNDMVLEHEHRASEFIHVRLCREDGVVGHDLFEHLAHGAQRVLLQPQTLLTFVVQHTQREQDGGLSLGEDEAVGLVRVDDVKAAVRLVVPQIPNGACLQLGIGGMPNAIGSLIAQSDLKDLGVHTEMYVDAFVDIAKAGKITGAHKQLDKGRQVYAFGAGTQKMYDYLNNNPECMSAPVDYTNDIRSISALDNFISINNAVDIDLFGQVNAESAGVKHISGAGGQLDFVLGAYLSKGGKSFICLSSTFFNKKTGQLESRIRPTLENGSIITDTRANLHYLCTEYGCVNLKGLTTWEKAEALINVAHPDFREELIKEAEKMHIWRRSNKI